MKLILVLLTLISPIAAICQTSPPTQTFGGKYYRFTNALGIGGPLFLPRADTGSTDPTLFDAGMFVYRELDSLLYWRKGNKMTPLAGGTGNLADYYTKIESDLRFIRNQNASAQAANYWISGRGTIDSILRAALRPAGNYALFVDSTTVTTNVNVLLNNSASNISNATHNFVIDSNVIAGTTELAVINATGNYGVSNYWGWHMNTSIDGNVHMQTIGRGPQRARPLIIGKSNDVEGTTNFAKIDTTGNISIGTMNAANAKLTVVGATMVRDSGLHIIRDGSATIQRSFRLSNANETRGANFQLDANANPGLNLWIHNGTSYTNRMTWDATGNVGIGITNPTSKLYVNGDANIVTRLTVPEITEGTSGGTQSLFIAGGYFNSFRGGEIQLRGGAASANPGIVAFHSGTGSGSGQQPERMRIDASGNVGIGTTSITSKFDVNGYTIIGTAGSERLSTRFNGIGFNRDITNGNIFSSGGHAYQIVHTANVSASSDLLTFPVFNTAGASVNSAPLSINGLGFVGINTTAQNNPLEVRGSSSSTGSAMLVANSTPSTLMRIDNNGEILLFNAVKIITGSGSPEGVKTAGPGSFYLNVNGGANITFYVKESGTGNTGWIAK